MRFILMIFSSRKKVALKILRLLFFYIRKIFKLTLARQFKTQINLAWQTDIKW